MTTKAPSNLLRTVYTQRRAGKATVLGYRLKITVCNLLGSQQQRRRQENILKLKCKSGSGLNRLKLVPMSQHQAATASLCL